MRIMSHWLFQSLLFYLLFVSSYMILESNLTTKSAGLIEFYATLFFWLPNFVTITISFYIKYRLSPLSRTFRILLLQFPALLYMSYRLFNRSGIYIDMLIRDFPLEGDWLIYFIYLTWTVLFSIKMNWEDK
jgi:hypothetical protein